MVTEVTEGLTQPHTCESTVNIWVKGDVGEEKHLTFWASASPLARPIDAAVTQ